MAKSAKLLKALQKGPRTAAWISSKLDIPNPRATVSYLRTQGYKIQLDESGKSNRYVIR